MDFGNQLSNENSSTPNWTLNRSLPKAEISEICRTLHELILKLETYDGSSSLPEVTHECETLRSLLPAQHPSSRALNDFVISRANCSPDSNIGADQIEAACQILTYDLFRNRATLKSPLHSLTPLFSSGQTDLHLSLTEWRSGTEVTVYKDMPGEPSAESSSSDSKRELLIKIPHRVHAKLAHARAFKKQTFGSIIVERVPTSVATIEPLVAHHYFWEQYLVEGLTFEEIIGSTDKTASSAGLNRWDNIRKVIDAASWHACWDSFPQIVEIIQGLPISPDSLGKRFPDFDPKNLILVGSNLNPTVTDIESLPVAIIDW